MQWLTCFIIRCLYHGGFCTIYRDRGAHVAETYRSLTATTYVPSSIFLHILDRPLVIFILSGYNRGMTEYLSFFGYSSYFVLSGHKSSYLDGITGV